MPPGAVTRGRQRRGCPYLVQRHDFAVGLLDLPEFLKEVPKAGLGDDRVGGKQAHAVKLGGRIDIRWELAPDDLVFLEATCWNKLVSVGIEL